jgi:SAM-dependent methyltransferase
MLLKKFLGSIDHRLGIRNLLRGLPLAGFDLDGEKILDWGWCLACLPPAPSLQVLDIGCVQSPIVPAAITLGHEVVGIDTDRIPYELPGFTFYQTDFLDHDFGSVRFDVVVLCSVVEHIGLAGRYAQRDIPDGDLQAMRKAATLLRSDGILILTMPVGRDMVFTPWHRIYGVERLSRLLKGFVVEKERFLIKEPGGLWHLTERVEALRVSRNGLSYALGQFLLKTRGDK